ncbi:Kinase-like protein [Mycena venus]|uniref:Kinase-like protein n=1 Tax=Mycena venus TaxID=2733690 RepID=A0A8H7CTS7_9AGAR|nr:Kinase-like protein [Mycena venus]
MLSISSITYALGLVVPLLLLYIAVQDGSLFRLILRPIYGSRTWAESQPTLVLGLPKTWRDIATIRLPKQLEWPSISSIDTRPTPYYSLFCPPESTIPHFAIHDPTLVDRLLTSLEGWLRENKMFDRELSERMRLSLKMIFNRRERVTPKRALGDLGMAVFNCILPQSLGCSVKRDQPSPFIHPATRYPGDHTICFPHGSVALQPIELEVLLAHSGQLLAGQVLDAKTDCEGSEALALNLYTHMTSSGARFGMLYSGTTAMIAETILVDGYIGMAFSEHFHFYDDSEMDENWAKAMRGHPIIAVTVALTLAHAIVPYKLKIYRLPEFIKEEKVDVSDSPITWSFRVPEMGMFSRPVRAVDAPKEDMRPELDTVPDIHFRFTFTKSSYRSTPLTDICLTQCIHQGTSAFTWLGTASVGSVNMGVAAKTAFGEAGVVALLHEARMYEDYLVGTHITPEYHGLFIPDTEDGTVGWAGFITAYGGPSLRGPSELNDSWDPDKLVLAEFSELYRKLEQLHELGLIHRDFLPRNVNRTNVKKRDGRITNPFLKSVGTCSALAIVPAWFQRLWLPERILTAARIPGLALDAIRISDGTQVVLKIVETPSEETTISTFLINEPGAEKHTIPVLELIPLGDHPGTVGEVTEFVEQVLEYFFIAKISPIVISISRTSLSGGFHFVHSLTYDGVHYLKPFRGDESEPHCKTRTEAGLMKYYYIDFGLSACVAVGGSISLRSPTRFHDPFKVDVRLVGEMLQDAFLVVFISSAVAPRLTHLKEYTGLDLIVPFARELRHDNPEQRPDAGESLSLFRELVSKMSETELTTPVGIFVPDVCIS